MHTTSFPCDCSSWLSPCSLSLSLSLSHTHPICTTRTFFASFFFVCPCDSHFLCVQVKSSLFDLTKMSFRSEPNPNLPFTPAKKKKSNHTQLLCCPLISGFFPFVSLHYSPLVLCFHCSLFIQIRRETASDRSDCPSFH